MQAVSRRQRQHAFRPHANAQTSTRVRALMSFHRANGAGVRERLRTRTSIGGVAPIPCSEELRNPLDRVTSSLLSAWLARCRIALECVCASRVELLRLGLPGPEANKAYPAPLRVCAGPLFHFQQSAGALYNVAGP
eukprot:13000882-Alexandrium_andersonii.AAC.1